MRSIAWKSAVLLFAAVTLSTLLTLAVREPPFGAGWSPGRGALVEVPGELFSARFGTQPRQVFLWPDQPGRDLEELLAAPTLPLYEKKTMDAWFQGGQHRFITGLDPKELKPRAGQTVSPEWRRLVQGRRQAGWGLRRSVYHARRFFDYWRSPPLGKDLTWASTIIAWFKRDGNSLSQNVGHFVPFAFTAFFVCWALKAWTSNASSWFPWGATVGLLHGIAFEYIAEGCYCDPSTSDIYTNMAGGVWGACLAVRVFSGTATHRLWRRALPDWGILLWLVAGSAWFLQKNPKDSWMSALFISSLYAFLVLSCLDAFLRWIKISSRTPESQ